ncbi:kinesin-like protein Klp8 [Aspergillus tubingensis]|uniref:Kinesin-like protein Klp8 n=2 Tax=Aspergillus subgen. Circumdati TaxID=2720871 RepID=A0A8H3XUI1_ASPTU|nr:kinesin-domain-containing protein [Aspergillus tubingensis]GFN12393.1 kinesin-domain-containing protein [Aspergillus tubingensis]GLA56358.1 kinesin-like protein Klp8 [Aspergillus tubingensis]GLA75927.1 kinesin-like protein Klp8 [Aspergillus tubingensis]GLA86469.1 kinesin-like protein Klp8 [Aspergillus tubingensis]GLA93592.1 kinesin-like protein Klp8 [Aspergillus tubingensis]
MAGGGNIKVVVRVRPFNSREIDRGAKCIVQMKDNQTVLSTPPGADDKARKAGGGKGGDGGPKSFAFDRSYWSFDKNAPNFASQDNLFLDLGVPLLDNAFQGYNNCIFAYGQTGSGKSYSMMGYGKEYGVIPRICQDMFERIRTIQQDKNLGCTVEVSYLEIYNERVRDLLNPSNKGNLKVREHPSTGPYVEDLAKLVVRSFEEIENLMDEGNKARTVAATNMNETSSRSHAVFTLTLTQKRHDAETSMDTEKVSRISLVDLAGSERANSTGATGARLKEGAEINRSLSTLGRVIAALADVAAGKKKNASMVPYRDSILTWLLKDSLGGNSMTAMIAAISPADINFEETLSTLRYADSAKRIKNHAVVNEDPNARMIRELKEELAQLRSKLGGGAAGPGAGGAAGAIPAEEYYPPDTPLEKQLVSIQQPDGSVTKVSKAEIVEQLNQSEKLYKDLNQTWEEKLAKTEEIHKERESALEELGISIEKGFIGLSTPKKMPHLVNLSDDPLLAECLVYNIKPGTTIVGNMDQGSHVEIRLNGSKILDDHCRFENVDNVVTIIPTEGAAVMVNGLRIDKPKRLKSGFRIILGDFHIFRFNHPQEARAERVEQSLLRHSVTTSQLGSPAPNKTHDRTLSKTGSEVDGDSSRADSPMPSQRGRESDWFYARREAVSAVLGPDQISHMPDDELDALFEDVQKVRATRRGLMENEEDSDSLSSFPVRDKYMSNGTIDNFSLDTAITMPGTPHPNDENDGQNGGEATLQSVRQDMQRQLDRQKEEYQDKLRNAEASSTQGVDDLRSEKARMEEALRTAKEEFEEQLKKQKEAFESHMKDLGQPVPRIYENGFAKLDDRELEVARTVFRHWSQQNYVRMAEKVLQHASLLKEAQVMSHIMDKNVVFQFAIIDHGHNMASSYDLVLNGISGDEDVVLDEAKKPCVAVRVIDFKQCVIHLWSIEKLQRRVQAMRQLHQYIDRPDYIQHFKLENPFSEPCSPHYSLVGDADIPLTAVFETRVQDVSVEVTSPYTQNVIGIIRLSLEPSSAQAPSSTLKFNVVMRDMIGFAEWEGSDVHAQLFVPGISDEGGATTTQMITGFDETPVRFESVHSMSLPLSSPRTAALKICVYAKVTQMHLDKLLSWDDMRDSAEPAPKKRKTPRIAETEFYSEERHDVFARAQVLELAESGEYLPVEVVQSNSLDAGTYQLHQGLQRRILVNLTYSSTESLPWDNITNIRVGSVRLLDPWGKIPDQDLQTPDVALKFVQEPNVKENADGTSNITIIGQWDSSLHGSLLLDRVTADKYRVQVTLRWDLLSSRLQDPVPFEIDLTLQIQGRTYVRPQSMFKQFFNSTRIVHSTVRMFSLVVRPVSAKRAADLWRMNTQNDYVKGEELLVTWAPRKVSLVRDYIAARKRRRRVAELNAAKGALSANSLVASPPRSGRSTPLRSQERADRRAKLLQKYVDLWGKKTDPIEAILVRSNTEPPAGGAAFASRAKQSSSSDDGSSVQDEASLKPRFVASVQALPKNDSSLKSGYLLTPDDTNSHWVRRFVELRRPYLHIYSVPDGDEINAINLRNSRVDHAPDFARLLDGPGAAGSDRGTSPRGRPNVFAVYGAQNTFLFAARTEAQKVEWILKIDESYFSSPGARAMANHNA